MSIVLKVKAGAADDAKSILTEIAGPIRDEPGCALFEVHQKADDENTFYLYEQYADQAAIEEHLATPMFKRVEDELFPLVEDRVYNEYVTVAA
jgi:quinol monooxygenase YgiN